MRARCAATAFAFLMQMCVIPINAHAQTFGPNDYVTYNQNGWGAEIGPEGELLASNYDNVYSGGFFEVGVQGSPGFSLFFDNVSDLFAFMPAVGIPGPLLTDLSDPHSSPSGTFGGDVVALKLDIDFSDRNLLPSANGVKFGDLIIGADNSGLPALAVSNRLGSAFYGLSVRQFSDLANQSLGGAVPFSSDYAQSAMLLTYGFVGGPPSETAQRQLFIPPVSAVPELATWAMFLVGFAAVGRAMRIRRSQPETIDNDHTFHVI